MVYGIFTVSEELLKRLRWSKRQLTREWRWLEKKIIERKNLVRKKFRKRTRFVIKKIFKKIKLVGRKMFKRIELFRIKVLVRKFLIGLSWVKANLINRKISREWRWSESIFLGGQSWLENKTPRRWTLFRTMQLVREKLCERMKLVRMKFFY